MVDWFFNPTKLKWSTKLIILKEKTAFYSKRFVKLYKLKVCIIPIAGDKTIQQIY